MYCSTANETTLHDRKFVFVTKLTFGEKRFQMKAADSDETCGCSSILYNAETFYTMHCCVG